MKLYHSFVRGKVSTWTVLHGETLKQIGDKWAHLTQQIMPWRSSWNKRVVVGKVEEPGDFAEAPVGYWDVEHSWVPSPVVIECQ